MSSVPGQPRCDPKSVRPPKRKFPDGFLGAAIDRAVRQKTANAQTELRAAKRNLVHAEAAEAQALAMAELLGVPLDASATGSGLTTYYNESTVNEASNTLTNQFREAKKLAAKKEKTALEKFNDAKRLEAEVAQSAQKLTAAFLAPSATSAPVDDAEKRLRDIIEAAATILERLVPRESSTPVLFPDLDVDDLNLSNGSD